MTPDEAVHRVGPIEPGQVLVLTGLEFPDEPDLAQQIVAGLVDDLRRAAGHDRFVLVLVSADAGAPTVYLGGHDDALARVQDALNDERQALLALIAALRASLAWLLPQVDPNDYRADDLVRLAQARDLIEQAGS